ncbi:MAG TPA: hypothetical protein PKJ63_07290 [Cyclobacteriaceae bacterium]|nr:hypothetical protein [Cyclobacteriaceae bacterium]
MGGHWELKMLSDSRIVFLQIAAWSLVITAFTTLVAHLVNFSAPDFQSQILLAQDWGYILRNDIIILHCVLVIVSMLGLTLIGSVNTRGWLALGLLCFLVFGFAEIGRMTMANVFVNGLRMQYLSSSDASTQQDIRFVLENIWPLIGAFLFRVFILAFSLGCIFYGIAFWTRGWTGRIFIVWGVINLLAFVNEFLELAWLSGFIEYFSIVFQPLARLWIGVWFLKEIRRHGDSHTMPA